MELIVRCLVNTSVPSVPVLIQMSPVHNFQHYIPYTNFGEYYFPTYVKGFQIIFVLLFSTIKVLHSFLFSPISLSCPSRIVILEFITLKICIEEHGT